MSPRLSAKKGQKQALKLHYHFLCLWTFSYFLCSYDLRYLYIYSLWFIIQQFKIYFLWYILWLKVFNLWYIIWPEVYYLMTWLKLYYLSFISYVLRYMVYNLWYIDFHTGHIIFDISHDSRYFIFDISYDSRHIILIYLMTCCILSL